MLTALSAEADPASVAKWSASHCPHPFREINEFGLGDLRRHYIAWSCGRSTQGGADFVSPVLCHHLPGFQF